MEFARDLNLMCVKIHSRTQHLYVLFFFNIMWITTHKEWAIQPAKEVDIIIYIHYM